MAFNTEGFVSGGAAGAGVGSRFGPQGAIIGGLAGGLLGGLGAKRKRLPQFDIGRINQLILQGGQEQRQQIGRLRPETEKQLAQFRTDISGAQERAKAAREAERARFLSELDPVTSRLLQSQTEQLKRTTFGGIPEAQQAAREAIAATGGLGRGIAAEQLARIPVQAAQQFAEGAAGLQQESLRAQQQALANLQSQESQAIAANLGIDANTYNTILNTGNAALINELNALVDESRRRTEGLVGAEQFRQTGEFGRAAGEAAGQQELFSGLLGFGGQLLGQAGRSQGVREISPAERTGRERAEASLENTIRQQQQRFRRGAGLVQPRPFPALF
jgi:hypothetical protein